MSDHEAIQGEWESIAPSRPGYRIPIGPELIGSKLRYQLQPNSVPKQIQLEHRDPGGRPRSSVEGVYELSGDSLIVRWSDSNIDLVGETNAGQPAMSVLHLQRVL